MRQDRADLGRCGLEIGKVGRPIGALRRGNTQVVELSVLRGLGGADHKPELARPEALVDQPVEALFHDRDLTGAETRYLRFIDVGTDDVVAQMGEAGPRGQSDITGTNNGDRGHQHPPLQGCVVQRDLARVRPFRRPVPLLTGSQAQVSATPPPTTAASPSSC